MSQTFEDVVAENKQRKYQDDIIKMAVTNQILPEEASEDLQMIREGLKGLQFAVECNVAKLKGLEEQLIKIDNSIDIIIGLMETAIQK